MKILFFDDFKLGVLNGDQIVDVSGLVEGVPGHSQFARHLAESGCRVVIPTLISRKSDQKPNQISKREWLYRSAFELGRHLIGYELQKIFAVVDWFSTQSQDDV